MTVRGERQRAGSTPREPPGNEVLGVLNRLTEKLDAVGRAVAELHELIGRQSPPAKLWYTTGELAGAIGLSQYTIQAHWCAEGRIECEKDPDTKKWRIPATEYDRLVRGGSPRARPKGG